MSHVALANLRSYTLDNAGAMAAELTEFVLAYFENADPDELQARSTEQLFGMAQAHLRLLDSVPNCHGARIRVFNPDLAEDGFTSEHTVIQIAHDDMPFLVDSVAMAINRSARTAHWIVHPLLVLTREEGGRLTKTQLAATDGQHHEPVKSLIFVECDRIVQATERQALALELAGVLGDVHAAVSDWSQMLARLQRLCANSCQPGLLTAPQQEGVEFLRWLEDRHFTFLGAREYDMQRTGDDIELVALPETGLGILRGEPRSPVSVLPPDAQVYLKSDQMVLVTKAMTRSTVHRPAWLDCIAVKRFDDAGKLVGESTISGALHLQSLCCSGVRDSADPQTLRRGDAQRWCGARQSCCQVLAGNPGCLPAR
jgi:glutamate dehydrogenase